MPIGNPRNTHPSFGCFQHTTYYFYHMMKLMKCSDRNVMYLRVSGPLGFIHLSKNSSGSFLGNVRDTVNKVDTSFSLMWFTFILFYSDLLILYNGYTFHLSKMENTMNGSTLKTSYINPALTNMSQITAAIFSCKTKRCSQKMWCLTSWSSKMRNCKGIRWLVFGKACCIQRC